jgi:quercetin dioxygenase-like cupin family protein
MMRRIGFPLATAMIVVLLLGMAAIVPRSGTLAQEASPPADDQGGLPGLTFEPLAGALVEALPPGPVLFSMSRVTVDPGAMLPIPADDPSVGLIRVESGVLTVRIEAPAQVIRANDATMAGEEVAAGEAFTLAEGDSTLLPANAAGEIRNDTTTPVVVLAAFIEPVPTP